MASSKENAEADEGWPRKGTEQQKLAKDNLHGLMDQVDEVKDKMRDNMEMVIERGQKLEELSDRAQSLDYTAKQLAERVKKH